eukprot:scaffold35332_cov54-Phaeocystis_antarctica.AAC.3
MIAADIGATQPGCPSPRRSLALYGLSAPSADPSGAPVSPQQHATHPRAAFPCDALHPRRCRCPPAHHGRGVAHLKQLDLEAKTLAPQPGHVQSPGRMSPPPPPPPPIGGPPP